MLFQGMWTAGLGWDEEMKESLITSARAWFTELHDLKQLQIPRCLQKREQRTETVSLHTFVDASEGMEPYCVRSTAIQTVLFRLTLWPLRHVLHPA